ncbi:Ca-activated chloride channel family protein [Microlunatus sagamiharensis]|uniref:Ca-activated chloride channel family protein n=1 Tax=Microlunatus sagamiharensis TaxID=546874 RepID=A0A1H2MGL4_9ACTN|nr:VWA domain-containing protein [Microlunatus sagamiharensis]SDU92360.1 Ca-activated chloride channel family protein [Microlunatus sagamiharensis]
MTPLLAPLNVFGDAWSFFSQLSFASPGRMAILVVIPLLVAAYVLATRRKNRRGMRFTNTSMLDVVIPRQSQWRRHLAVALSLLSLITLTTAFAQPTTEVNVPRERATVVLVIDASLSMQATDVPPNRLDAAKAAAVGFVNELPEKYNVSVVSMAGATSILVPPTLQHSNVANAINSIKLQDSTAIGAGIDTAMAALQQAPKDPDHPDDPAPGAIVLLSDGTNQQGRAPQQAAADARKAEVPIYTIAYGTENGYVDLDGQRNPVPVDTELMQQIAQISDGQYFSAATPEQLRTVYENISSEVGYEKADREVTAQFAGFGLAFAVLAALGAISLGAKWP